MAFIAAAADIGIDTANLASQNDDQNKHANLLAIALPSALIWGGFWAGDKLKNAPFNLRNKKLLHDMRGLDVAKRRAVAESYFTRHAASIAQVEKITNKAEFAGVSERAFTRFAAGSAIRGAATLANVGLFIAPQLFGALYHGFKGIKKLGYELETPNMGGHFVLNGAQATDRQRSLMAMHNSEFNGRSAIGNEAQLLHN